MGDGQSLRHASVWLRADIDVVAAAARDGLALRWASEALRDNRDLALVAILQNPMALQVCSEKLRHTKKVVLEAVKRRVAALDFASESLQNDSDVAVAAMEAPVTKPRKPNAR